LTIDDRLAGLERRTLGSGLTLYVAADRRARRRGLARLEAPAPASALLLEHCRSIHTIGMRYALDLVWIDAGGVPVRLDEAVGPWRLRTCLRARAVIEAAAGDGARFAAALTHAGQ
jgi:uncharacterized membrane protein (UPF0127 family)